MKKDEVPQDDKNLNEGKLKDVCYALDENGNYVQVLSTGWEPKNVVMLQAWDIINEQAEEARKKVLEGEFSPLLFHMERNQMDIKLLSEYTGFSKGKIKEHLHPEQFKKASRADLETYAEAFNMNPDDILRVE